jgi:hypothetical protein
MRRRYAVIGVLFTILTPWADAVACSCARPVLADLYKDSTRVFLGEVERIELLTKDPVEGQKVTYVATVRPQEIFKGSSNASVRVTFQRKYATPRPSLSESELRARATVLDPTFAERTLTIVDGCSSGMAEGSKYYIFERQGEPLADPGWCSPRIVYDSIIKLDYMRTLRDARQHRAGADRYG